MTDWQPILQKFAGILNQEPAHLAPSVSFKAYASLTTNLICPLTNISYLSIQGIDAEKFLQGQLTCNVNEITKNTSKLTGHCNPKGRLHGIFYVIQLDTNHYCLVIPSIQLEHIQTSLKKYAIFSKVKIQPLPIYSFGLVGDQKCIDLIDLNLSKMAIFDKYDQDKTNTCFIKIPCHDKHLSRYLIILDPSQLSIEAVIDFWHNLTQLGFHSIGTIDWHKFNLLSLLPSIYPETTEKCLPHTLNLPQLGAVSFKKGCYTGQEIVARMEYLGNIKKTIVDSEFQPNTPLPILGESISDKSDHILLDYVPLETTALDHRYLGLFVTDISSSRERV